MKITITRLLETSKYLATEVGQQIPDFFSYMGDLVDNTVRALRNGLTFLDNFDCTVITVAVVHNTPQVVSVPKTAVGILTLRLVSTSYGIDSFAWYYDERGRLSVKVGITGAPTLSQQVVLAILH